MRYSILIAALFAFGCGHRTAAPVRNQLVQRGLAESSADSVADSGEQPLPTEGTFQRKIIYTAEVELVVEDFDPISEQVQALASQFGGFVASSTVTGSPGSPRTGEWKIRVPVERYEELLAAARKLGEVHRVSIDSQDVTEEYYDVETRLRNKRAEEAALRKLLEDATGDLEDVLAVQRELSRVAEEIERVEGRLRVLKDVTSLTTVTLTIREIRDYAPEEAASYFTRVRRGLRASLEALADTAVALSIAMIVALPWLAVVLVLGILLVLLRRLARRGRPRQVTPKPAE